MTAIEAHGQGWPHIPAPGARRRQLVGDRLGERVLTAIAGPRPGPRRTARRAGTAVLGGVIVGLAYVAFAIVLDVTRDVPPSRVQTTPPIEDAKPDPSIPVAAPPAPEPENVKRPEPSPLPGESPGAISPSEAPPAPDAVEEIILESVEPLPEAPPPRFETRDKAPERAKAIKPRAPMPERAAPRFELPESLRPSS